MAAVVSKVLSYALHKNELLGLIDNLKVLYVDSESLILLVFKKLIYWKWIRIHFYGWNLNILMQR